MAKDLIRGMPAADVIRDVTNWWENKGRHAMRQTLMRQAEMNGNLNKGMNGAFASLDPTSENFMPSGIIHGWSWDQLNQREKLHLIKTYLDHFHPVEADDTTQIIG